MPLFSLPAQEFPVVNVEDEANVIPLRTWFQVRQGDGNRNPWWHHCCRDRFDSSSTWTLGWKNRFPSCRASADAWRTQICASALDHGTVRIPRCRISSAQGDAVVCRCARLFLCGLQSHQDQGQLHGSLRRDTASHVLLLGTVFMSSSNIATALMQTTIESVKSVNESESSTVAADSLVGPVTTLSLNEPTAARTHLGYNSRSVCGSDHLGIISLCGSGSVVSRIEYRLHVTYSPTACAVRGGVLSCGVFAIVYCHCHYHCYRPRLPPLQPLA